MFSDSFSVGGSNQIDAGECAHQDKQTTTWKMKVRDQGVEPTKDVAWADEHSCFTPKRLQRSSGRSGFENSGRCGPNRYNPAALEPVCLNTCSDFRGQFRPFGVQFVLFELFYLDRIKCTEADMKDQIDPTDFRARETREEFFGKMKSCRRGSD